VTNSHLRLVGPSTENCTVAARRPKNAKLRTLTPDEVERLIEAAKTNRHGHRDALMVLLAYRHGLSERVLQTLDCRRVL
jgi:site-specific recombinase XerD